MKREVDYTSLLWDWEDSLLWETLNEYTQIILKVNLGAVNHTRSYSEAIQESKGSQSNTMIKAIAVVLQESVC